jgi:hypothetical protein
VTEIVDSDLALEQDPGQHARVAEAPGDDDGLIAQSDNPLAIRLKVQLHGERGEHAGSEQAVVAGECLEGLVQQADGRVVWFDGGALAEAADRGTG